MSNRQPELPDVPVGPPRVAIGVRLDMRTRQLGSLAGFWGGKNIYIDLCDRCHQPGIYVGKKWYHEQPIDQPCTLDNAPRPALDAQRRLLQWYQWCQAKARKATNVEVERAKQLELLVAPMTTYLLDQIARPDRRHLPTVSETRMITEAMRRSMYESDIDPIEFEEWTAKSTS